MAEEEKDRAYSRGPFRLGRLPNSAPNSSWYIWWFVGRREKRRSTRTSDFHAACEKLDEQYLASHRPTEVEKVEYTVADAMSDYYIEHAQHLASATATRPQLGLFDRYRQARQDAGLMPSPLLPIHMDDRMLNDFRKWGVEEDFIVTRRKDAAGNWIDGSTRQRTASTVEESIIKLKAALNYAFKNRRVMYVPPLAHKTRDVVSKPRSYRLSLSALGELLDYSYRGMSEYDWHADKLLPMRRYLIAAICTLGRPDAIFDINVTPGRTQWSPNEMRLNLNYEGRVQTKKVRPVLPVVGVLNSWMRETDEWFVCGERYKTNKLTGLKLLSQYRVQSIDRSWTNARKLFGIPDGFGPKLIRYSMATILASRDVDLVQLEMAMGHRVLSRTTSRYATFKPDYLSTIKDGIEDVLSDLSRSAGDALLPKRSQNGGNIVLLRA